MAWEYHILEARRNNDSGYLECDFTDGPARLIEALDGMGKEGWEVVSVVPSIGEYFGNMAGRMEDLLGNAKLDFTGHAGAVSMLIFMKRSTP